MRKIKFTCIPKRLLLSIVLSCTICVTQAQVEPVYSVPSPDIAALGTYGSTPISLYTGTPNISIPLYDLHIGNYDFPIEASYHLSSVKAHAQEGVLGLGWSLIADGFITRTVRGVYDEKKCSRKEHGYYGHARRMKNISNQDFDRLTRDSLMDSSGNHGYFELSPDEFTFSFCGYSGNFYLNEDGGWSVVSDHDIKLEFNSQDGFVSIGTLRGRIPRIEHWRNRNENQRYFNKFTLITPDGCRYEFGGVNATEYSIPYYSRNNSDLIATTWRLSRITTPDGRNITFTYNTNSIMCNLQYNPQSSTLYEYYANPEYLHQESRGITGFSGFLVFPVVLSSITTPNDTVKFTYEPYYNYGAHFDRGEALFWDEHAIWEDPFVSYPMPEYNPSSQFFELIEAEPGEVMQQSRENIRSALLAYTLQRMVVRNKHGEIARCVYFDYTGKSRKKLSRIRFRSSLPNPEYVQFEGGGVMYTVLNTQVEDEEGMPTWRFTYDKKEMPQSYVLPKPNAWGYYSDKTYSLSENAEMLEESNLCSTAETLSSIIWPTGGSTTFSYEMNKYSKIVNNDHSTISDTYGFGAGLRVSHIVNHDRWGKVESVKKYHYTEAFPSANGEGHSSGICSGVRPKTLTYRYGNIRYDLSSTNGFFPCVTGQTAPDVGYSCVIEETLDSNNVSCGYVKHRYTNYEEGVIMNHTADHTFNVSGISYSVPYTSVSSALGKLLSREYYDRNNRLVKKESYEYQRVGDGSIMTPVQQMLILCRDPEHFLSANLGWIVRRYTFSYLPVKVTEETWGTDGSSPVRKEVRYAYDERKMVVCDSTLMSDGGYSVRSYTRPYDDNRYQWMTDRHILSPIVTETTVQEGKVRIVTNEYDAKNHSFCNPYIKRRTVTADDTSRTEYEVLSADEYGNPMEIVEKGKHTTLVWGHSGQRLRARIENYSQTTNGYFPLIYLEPIEDGEDYAEDPPTGSNLEQFYYGNFADVLIHQYIYDRFLRLSAYIRPDLFTLHYDYDGLGRLHEVYFYENMGSDKTKKTLKMYKYYYYDKSYEEIPETFMEE